MTSSPTKHSRPRRRGIRILLAVVAAIAVAALLLTGGYWYLRQQGRLSFLRRRGGIDSPSSAVSTDADDPDLITYQGKTYRYNENIVSLLFLGVDKKDVQANEGYGKNGQADSLFLAALDTGTGRVRIIPLTRESMVDVDLYTVEGNYAGTQKLQLCLAYAYGSTGEDCSRNVARSVSRLLYGIPVDAFVTIDLQGVQKLTDAVGGVSVEALESFTTEGYTFRQGKSVTLRGAGAEAYIRYRTSTVDGNTKRMKRQQQFLSAFFNQAKAKLRSNITLIGSYYNVTKPYIVSDLTLPQITYLATSGLAGGTGNGLEYIQIAGETVQGAEFVEFYPDQSSAYEAVLAAFYTPAEQ